MKLIINADDFDFSKNINDGKLKIDYLDIHHHLMDKHNIKQDIVDISSKLNFPIGSMIMF